MTRKIDLRTTWASPEGVVHPGTYSLPRAVAKGLVDSRQADYADGLPPEGVAVAAPAPEKAVVVSPQAPVPPQAPVVPPEVKIDLKTPAWGKGAPK